MSNRYSAKQATDAIASLDLDALSPKEIEASLKDIISQLDTTPFNTSNSATTVLYSGTSVEDIKDNPKFRVLDNTEAYKFLMEIEDNRPLMNALEKAYGEKPDFRDWTSKAGIFIGGDDRVTPRVGGAWDWVSANFVYDAQGNVVTKVGEGAGVNRVFFGTEIPGAKANPNITHIDHVEKQALFKELEALGDPQHQLNHFKTITFTREEVFNVIRSAQMEQLTKKEGNIFQNNVTQEDEQQDLIKEQGQHSFSPYDTYETNFIYNLLFCDTASLFYPKEDKEFTDWHKTLFQNPTKEDVLNLANDENSESRVRALAYNWLRENGYEVTDNILLGVIIEVSLENGLDTLAVFKDTGIRYISHGGSMVYVEQMNDDDKIVVLAKEFINISNVLYKDLKLNMQERYAPPVNFGVKVTFLTSKGLSCFSTTMNELNSYRTTSTFLNKATEILIYVTGCNNKSNAQSSHSGNKTLL